MSKWSREWLEDMAERAGTTLIYGVITMLTADASGAISGNPQQWWVIVGLPTVLSVLKAVLVNLGGPEPTASLVNVTSTKGGDAVKDEKGVASTGNAIILALAVVGIVLVVLLLAGVI